MLFSIHNLPPISDDHWHHMAITWTTDGGRWDFFLDGAHRSSIDDIRSGHVIASQSTLVLGENEYTSNKHLYGSLSRFNVWDKRFSMELIVALARDPGHDQGNVISWKNVLESLKYYVSHTEPSTVASSGECCLYFIFSPCIEKIALMSRFQVKGRGVQKTYITYLLV